MYKRNRIYYASVFKVIKVSLYRVQLIDFKNMPSLYNNIYIGYRLPCLKWVNLQIICISI